MEKRKYVRSSPTNIKGTKECTFCGKGYEGTARGKFCSSKCRVYSHRKNK